MRKDRLSWVRFYTKLKQTVLNSRYVKTMGVRKGGKEHCPSLNIGTKHQNFLENLMSAVQFRLIDLFLAMTVYLLLRHSHCTARFTVLVSCSDELAVHSCPEANLRADFSTSGLYCATITWKQVFSCSETVSADIVK